MENKTVYAYDALHGGFKLNISDFVKYKNLEEQKIEISLEEELNYVRNFEDKKNFIQNMFNKISSKYNKAYK